MKLSTEAKARLAGQEVESPFSDEYLLDFDWGWEVWKDGERLSCSASPQEAVLLAQRPT